MRGCLESVVSTSAGGGCGCRAGGLSKLSLLLPASPFSNASATSASSSSCGGNRLQLALLLLLLLLLLLFAPSHASKTHEGLSEDEEPPPLSFARSDDKDGSSLLSCAANCSNAPSDSSPSSPSSPSSAKARSP